MITYYTDEHSLDLVVDAFIAVASIFSGGSIGLNFNSIAGALLLVSVIVGSIVGLQKFSAMPIAQNLFFGFFVWICLLAPKDSVNVTIDYGGGRSNSVTVSGIPVGLSIIAYGTNTIARMFAKAYSAALINSGTSKLSDYNATGIFSGPRMINAIMRYDGMSGQDRDWLSVFGRSCLEPEILSQSVNTAPNSGNGIELFAKNTNVINYITSNLINPARSMGYGGSVFNCSDAWTWYRNRISSGGLLLNTSAGIKGALTGDSGETKVNRTSIARFVSDFIGTSASRQQIQSGDDMNRLDIGLAATGGIIKAGFGSDVNTWSAAMGQSIMAKYFITSFSQDMSLGRSESALAFSNSMAKSQAIMTNATSASSFIDAAPKLKAIAEALIIYLFPFVILMAVIAGANFFAPIGAYTRVFAWLSLWQPIYLIITHMMTEAWYLPQLTKVQGDGLSMSNIGSIVSLNDSMQNQAGAILWSVPMIAWLLVKAGDAGVTSVFSSIGSIAKGTAEKSGTEAGAGNVNMSNSTWGNTTHDNASSYNTTAHQMKTSASIDTGRTSIGNGMGATVAMGANGGNKVLSVEESRGPVTASTADTVNSSSTKTTASGWATNSLSSEGAATAYASQILGSAAFTNANTKRAENGQTLDNSTAIGSSNSTSGTSTSDASKGHYAGRRNSHGADGNWSTSTDALKALPKAIKSIGGASGGASGGMMGGMGMAGGAGEPSMTGGGRAFLMDIANKTAAGVLSAIPVSAGANESWGRTDDAGVRTGRNDAASRSTTAGTDGSKRDTVSDRTSVGASRQSGTTNGLQATIANMLMGNKAWVQSAMTTKGFTEANSIGSGSGTTVGQNLLQSGVDSSSVGQLMQQGSGNSAGLKAIAAPAVSAENARITSSPTGAAAQAGQSIKAEVEGKNASVAGIVGGIDQSVKSHHASGKGLVPQTQAPSFQAAQEQIATEGNAIVQQNAAQQGSAGTKANADFVQLNAVSEANYKRPDLNDSGKLFDPHGALPSHPDAAPGGKGSTPKK